ncbi:MAG: alpha/beta fold hydrolase [Pseudomonadota bacterium]
MGKHHFIFLPGFMCDGRLFADQADALNRAGHSCASPSLAGHASIEGLAARILDTAPDTFVPVGLSMGGILALELVRQAPDRISHLALLNTTYHEDKAGAERAKQLERVRAGELDLVLRDELKPNYMYPANRSAERLKLLSDMTSSLGEEAFETQTKALMQRRSYAETLDQISCPTLIMVGKEDTVCPPSIHRDMAEHITGSRLVVLPRCGHLSSIEQPDKVTGALFDLIADDQAAATDRALSQTS